MAVIAFNCNKIKHTYWPFIFKNQENGQGNTVPGKKLMVRMPSKSMFEKIQEFQKITEMDKSEVQAEDVINSLHDLIAEILNNNLENPNPKKPKIIRLRLEEGRTIHSITKEYGISKESIRRWCNEFQKECQAQSLPASSVNEADIMKENLRLRKELAEKEKEILFLKKAAAFFAKEID